MSIADDWEYGALYDEIAELQYLSGKLVGKREAAREIAELKVQTTELQKDKERLDWLLSEDSGAIVEVGRYGRGDEYKPWIIDTIHNRSDIDKAMEGEV